MAIDAVKMTAVETVAAGFVFTEDPRWRDGRLYFSDTIAGRVCAVDEDGHTELMAELDEHCSGLGFLPGGDLLIVASESRRLLRRGPAGLTVHADLSALTPHPLNDMAVDAEGRAYVVELVYDAADPLRPKPGAMWLVRPTAARRSPPTGC